MPDPAFGEALFRWAAPAEAGGRPHPSVTATSATSRDGRRVRFLHNWSWDPVSVSLPTAAEDVLTRTAYEAGQSVELGPWDVKVFAERGLLGSVHAEIGPSWATATTDANRVRPNH